MKRSWEDWSNQAAKRPAAIGASTAGGSGGQVAIKLLFPPAEAVIVNGEHGETAQLLESLTNTKVKLSKESDFYPGTELREVAILGATVEAVSSAACLALAQIAGSGGAVTGGEAGVEPGGARVKVVLPAEAVAALKSGDALRRMTTEYGVQTHVIPVLIPPGEVTDLSEQVVCLSGALNGVHEAMQLLAEPLGRLASKTWFRLWAGHSNVGLKVPGLSLLDGATASTSSGRRSASKWDETPQGRAGGQRVGAGDATVALSATGPLLMKLLISQEEASVLRHQDNAAINEIQQVTGTDVLLSSDGELYPGTALQELAIQGPTAEAVVAAASEAFNKVIEACGQLSGGDVAGLEPGGARMKVIVPAKATSAVIGPQGKIVAQMRVQTGMHVHVETNFVPPGPMSNTSEQVVSFDGPLSGVQTGLVLMADILSQYTAEPWFASWATNSHSGMNIPGFVLFTDGKGGKGKGGKAKGKGKDLGSPFSRFDAEPDWGGSFGSAAGPAGPAGPQVSAFRPPARNSGGLVMKLLLPANEASCILGKGGSVIREMMSATSSRIGLSGRNEFYPGTQLQELKVQGPTMEAVVSALGAVVGKISELTGSISGGESNVEPGHCRLKVLVPNAAAAAIIGPGGAAVKKMREATGMFIHIDEAIIPPGPPTELSEQAVCLSGPLQGALLALTILTETVSHLAQEPWYDAWGANSHCGLVIPGLVLFTDAKGRGKGKAKGKGKEDGFFNGVESFKGADTWKGGGGKGSGAGTGALGPWDYSSAGHSSPPHKPATPEVQVDGTMALKVLVSPEDVAVLGQDPAAMQEIQQATSTTGLLSDKSYPGTNLMELTVQGPSGDAVFNALLLILNRIGEVMGSVRSGETFLQPGDAAVKLVVPKRAAATVIGPGGQHVRQIKEQTGVRVSVDMNSIPCNDRVSEQAILITGPFANIHVALQHVTNEVTNCSHDPWFQFWAAHSNTGLVVPGLVLFEGGKGKGKGKAKGGPM